MKLDDYQKQAASFFWGGSDDVFDILGLSLGVCGEAGELAEKIKKLYFNKKMEITDEDLGLIGKEIGDTLWYLAALSEKLGLSLDDAATNNIAKLNKRKDTKTLKGDGDEMESI